MRECSITEHTSELHGLVDQLTTMKIIMDDELQALLLLSSLSDSSETLVMSMNNSVSNEKLTLDMVTNRLKNRKSRKKIVEVVLFESDPLVSKKQER